MFYLQKPIAHQGNPVRVPSGPADYRCPRERKKEAPRGKKQSPRGDWTCDCC